VKNVNARFLKMSRNTPNGRFLKGLDKNILPVFKRVFFQLPCFYQQKPVFLGSQDVFHVPAYSRLFGGTQVHHPLAFSPKMA